MSEPYYADESVRLFHGDALVVLPTLADGSVDCVVTSPPYYGLRDYGVAGQHGLEASPAEYVETMRAVFGEVWRVLSNQGTLWINLGDSYYSGKGSPTQPDEKNQARRPPARILDKPGQTWGRQKSLLGIPWRVAFALQDDGWILRNAVIWDKPNAMPESVTDRLSTRYEHVFLFSKSRRYWFNLDPIREQGDDHDADDPRGRNPGDVWTIPTQPFPEAHFAVMAPRLADRCVQAGCKPGGTVLDPYSGVGTTGQAAARNGNRYVGIELSRATLDLSLRTRLAQAALLDDGGAA
jgi:DNA modification methylase